MRMVGENGELEGGEERFKKRLKSPILRERIIKQFINICVNYINNIKKLLE